jgi:hypothetical protein
VDRVLAHGQREVLADGARVGLGGVGRAHHFAVLGNGAFAFQHLHDDRLGGHELDQLTIERAVLVDFVELARLFRRQLDALLRDDAQARILELGVDLAGQVAAGGVGLDDGKRAFDGHGASLVMWQAGHSRPVYSIRARLSGMASAGKPRA